MTCVTELTGLTGLDKASVHRLLTTLADAGLVRRISSSRRYRLGSETALLGFSYIQNHELRLPVLPAMKELAESTGETVTLAVYDRGWAIVLDRVDGSNHYRSASDVGLKAPIHAGASCKALLAHQPEPEVERVLSEIELTRFTPYTITDAAQLRAELSQIRKQGFAISRQEVRFGNVAVGAPVQNGASEVVAAISIAGPLDRFGEPRLESLVQEVIQAADWASGLLGSPLRRHSIM